MLSWLLIILYQRVKCLIIISDDCLFLLVALYKYVYIVRIYNYMVWVTRKSVLINEKSLLCNCTNRTKQIITNEQLTTCTWLRSILKLTFNSHNEGYRWGYAIWSMTCYFNSIKYSLSLSIFLYLQNYIFPKSYEIIKFTIY